MELNIKNKVAIVTGGVSGIGQKTAEYFLQEGVKVFIADINEAGLKTTLSLLKAMGGEVVGFNCDVADGKLVARMVQKALDVFGTVDFLVNSAGIGDETATLDKADQQGWQRVLDTNLVGTINCCKALMPVMKEKNHGTIVNIASEAGVSGEKGIEIYATSKGGVIAFTKSLAKSLSRNNVTVNVVAPAFVHTPMTCYITPELEKKWLKMYPLKRLGETKDVASMIVFLCSDRCSWITGQTISINGGFSMR
ncbi:MAG: glucose 1-dehydrogenase [Candidatus Tectomicrobia bacterium]|uniref:Glucose 1-dehydrogenase n=1 Tax=Tectimicrobiota bacterium TaxID=2528274 RepID=A0A933LPC3_UNCTE|nr:glucose 1-dehydrogenase [Candidatus Tectomicrobia bacterium]